MGQGRGLWAREKEGVCVEGPGTSGSPSRSAVGTDWEASSFLTMGAEASGETGEACIASVSCHRPPFVSFPLPHQWQDLRLLSVVGEFAPPEV